MGNTQIHTGLSGYRAIGLSAELRVTPGCYGHVAPVVWNTGAGVVILIGHSGPGFAGGER